MNLRNWVEPEELEELGSQENTVGAGREEGMGLEQRLAPTCPEGDLL